MKILIYGGSFDPVHHGHCALLKAACAQIRPDKVYVFTAFNSPFKREPFLPYAARKSMARRAFKNIFKNIIFDDFELRAARKTFAWQTVKYVKGLEPKAEIYLLTGSDCLNDLTRWKNAGYIFKNVVIAAGKRKGFAPARQRFKLVFIKGGFPEASSSQIRLGVLCGGQIPAGVLPDSARREIKNKNYYGLNVHKWLAKNLTPKRYAHTKAVAEEVAKLAFKYGANPEKMAVAALLHDAGKSMTCAEMINYCKKYKITVEAMGNVCKYAPSLLHCAVSQDIAKRIFKITDCEILNPVKNHTLGSLSMGLGEKLLFIADMSSKDRNPACARKIRAAAALSVDEGMLAAAAVKLIFTISKRQWLALQGIKLWNKLIAKK